MRFASIKFLPVALSLSLCAALMSAPTARAAELIVDGGFEPPNQKRKDRHYYLIKENDRHPRTVLGQPL